MAEVLRAVGIGEQGYVRFLKALSRLGVLSHDELLGWLELHGRVIRATEPPLHDGERFGEGALEALAHELRGWIE